MIEISDASAWRRCYCCGKEAAKEVAIRRDGQGNIFGLCIKCLEELAQKAVAVVFPGHGDLIEKDRCETFDYESRAGTPDDVFDAGVLFALDHLDDVPIIIPADHPKAAEDAEMQSKVYLYGMRLRGFSPGCQPMTGLVQRRDSTSRQYHDFLVYDHKLTDKELADYELDYLGVAAP